MIKRRCNVTILTALPTFEKNEHRHDMISNGRSHVLIQTDYVPSRSIWETLVFECDRNGIVMNYTELDCDRGTSFVQMHERMLDIWNRKLETEP